MGDLAQDVLALLDDLHTVTSEISESSILDRVQRRKGRRNRMIPQSDLCGCKIFVRTEQIELLPVARSSREGYRHQRESQRATIRNFGRRRSSIYRVERDCISLTDANGKAFTSWPKQRIAWPVERLRALLQREQIFKILEYHWALDPIEFRTDLNPTQTATKVNPLSASVSTLPYPQLISRIRLCWDLYTQTPRYTACILLFHYNTSSRKLYVDRKIG